MTKNSGNPPQQAKHFKHDDHAHAAHQEEAAHAAKPGHAIESDGKKHNEKTGQPANAAPKAPHREK